MTTKKFFLIGPCVANYQDFVDDRKATDRYLVLDSSRKGLDQMVQALAGVHDISSIQIFNHGAAASLNLGESTLDLSNVQSYQSQLAHIGASLVPDGNILFYGCDVAKDANGQQFIKSLSTLTGADVAASIDASSPVALDANSVMEAHVGVVENLVVSLEHLSEVLAANAPPSPDIAWTTLLRTSAWDNATSLTTGNDGSIYMRGFTEGNLNRQTNSVNRDAFITKFSTNE